MNDCWCTEHWESRESCRGDGEMSYTYTLLVSLDCPAHWPGYVARVEIIKEMREDAAHQ